MLAGSMLLYLLGVVALYGVEVLPDGERGLAYVAVHCGLTALCGVIAWMLVRKGEAHARSVVALAVLARLLLLGVTPFTTHDVHRYTWDGRVALSGADPYRVSPKSMDARELIEEGWYVAPEHQAYPTIYPPLALGLFSLSALGGPVVAMWLWKCLVTLASILTVLLGWRVCVIRGCERHLVWVALHPLGLLESGVGAHLDTVAALGVAWALWGWVQGRGVVVGVGLGLGIILKLSPAVMVAGVIRDRTFREVAWSVLCVVTLGYGIALALGWHPVGSLPTFAQSWRFGSTFDWLLSQFDLPRHQWIVPSVLVLGWGLFGWWGRRLDFPRLAQVFLGWLFFVSPVLFPWYLVVLLPLLSIAPSAILIGWLTVAPFTYEVIDAFDVSGVWAPSEWPMWVTVVTLGMGGAIDYGRGFWTTSKNS